MKLTSSRLLLTGASGGLGMALVHTLAQQGVCLLLAGRDSERLEAARRAATAAGTPAETISVDLTQAQGIAQLTLAAQRFEINGLINNAGVIAFGLYEEQGWDVAANMLEANLLAPMRLTQALLPWLKRRDEAAIVNIGSTFGSLPFAGFVAYSATKAGLRGFSQALRRELADSAVRVIHVSPRAIATSLNSPKVEALNRALGSPIDSPEVVARQIVAALASECTEQHLGFPERFFAWLNGCAPGLIDRALAGKLPLIKQHAKYIEAPSTPPTLLKEPSC